MRLDVGVSLVPRAGLYAHTTQALAAGRYPLQSLTQLSEPEFLELKNEQNSGNSMNSKNSGSDKLINYVIDNDRAVVRMYKKFRPPTSDIRHPTSGIFFQLILCNNYFCQH